MAIRKPSWEAQRARAEMLVAGEPLTAVEVLTAMVAMFDSGDPTHAARVVAADYLDHQGLGQGPIRGVDGFARVVTTNHAGYEEQDVTIEDIFGTPDQAVARIRWQDRTPQRRPRRPRNHRHHPSRERTSCRALGRTHLKRACRGCDLLSEPETGVEPADLLFTRLQEAGVSQCRSVPESAFEVGFYESAVSPSACGYRPVSVRTLEDPLEVSPHRSAMQQLSESTSVPACERAHAFDAVAPK